MKNLIRVFVCLLFSCGQVFLTQAQGNNLKDSIFWNSKNTLPGIASGNIQLGLAGALIGVSSNHLLIAGGANFSAGLPWKGGKKTFHQDVYIAKLTNGSQLKWNKNPLKIPYPIAYASNIPYEAGFISVGGENEHGALAKVTHWRYDEKKIILLQDSFPDLPVPLTNASAGVLNNRLYVLGGENENGASCAVWFLDLSNKESGWQEGPDLPVPTSHALAVVQADGEGQRLFVFGGRARQSSGISTLYNQVLVLSKQGNSWEIKSPIETRNGAVSALSGASGLASGASYVLIFGGDTGETFSYFEKFDQQIREETDELKKAELILQKNALLEQHTGFSKQVLLYNTITDTWTNVSNLPYAPVTTTAILWGNSILIPSGEIHPGIRTPKVLIGTNQVSTGMAVLDYTVILGYMLLMIGIGVWTGRGQTSTEDYFKGGQKIPGWAAGLSIYGTQLSAITFMSIPAKTYATNWLYFILQLTIILIIPIITQYFIPFYRKLNITSAYEYLELRFNYLVRAMGSLLYIMLQIGRLAIVLLLPSLALSIVANISVSNCILAMGIITIFYTLKGGITAVIWTDVAQVVILLGGALLCMVLMIHSVDQPWPEIWKNLQEAGKLQVIDAAFRLDRPTLWVVLVGGVAINVVSYGADQSVVQKFLTTKNEKESKKSIRLGAWMALPSAIIFFSIGTLLYVFYQQHPEKVNFEMDSPDAIFPWFIVSQLPPGVVGLLIAAVFAAAMSTLSSSINSVTTAITTDFYRRFYNNRSEKHYLSLAKAVTLVIGVIGTGLALAMAKWGIASLWDQFNMILGLFTGGLGGVFLLGIFSERTTARGAVLGVLISAALQGYIKDYTSIHFLLYAATGLVSCMVFGYLFSLLTPAPGKEINGLTIYKEKEG